MLACVVAVIRQDVSDLASPGAFQGVSRKNHCHVQKPRTKTVVNQVVTALKRLPRFKT